MNEFVCWCRHLLVSFLFHALTSLHPPSFHRNDFSTCTLINNVKKEKSRPADDSGVSCGLASLSLTEELN